jgi:hypothetical protein
MRDDDRTPITITTREHEVIEQAIESLANGSKSVFQRAGSLVHVLQEHDSAPSVAEITNAHLRTLLCEQIRFLENKEISTRDPKPRKTHGKKPEKPRKTTGATAEQTATYAAELAEYEKQLAAYETAKAAHDDAISRWAATEPETTTIAADAHPPEWCVKGIAGRGYWPDEIRQLAAVAEAPFLRPNGTICGDAGYDRATRTLYRPNAQFPKVPAKPSKDEARAALDRVAELVRDFPFASPAHQAAWLAGALSPFARPAHTGSVPFFLVDSNIKGSGKSMLIDAISVIFTGRPMARTSPATHDEEERKRITAILIGGAPLVLIDNIKGAFGSAAMDGVLTSEIWNDRILGKSEGRAIPARAIWYGTGNNVQLLGDIVRRTCHVRLQSRHERPELRDDFTIKGELIDHVRRNRAGYVRDLLTVLRAYFSEGCPKPDGIAVMGSYIQWSAIVRNALVWLGEPDPAETRAELEAMADSDANTLADLLAGWSEVCALMGRPTIGVTAAEALGALEQDDTRQRFPIFRAALAEIIPTKPGQLPSSKQLGMKFAQLRARVQDGRAIVAVGNERGAARWRVEVVSTAAVAVRDLAGPAGPFSVPPSEENRSQNKIKDQRGSATEREGSEAREVPQGPATSPAPPPSFETIEDKARRITREQGGSEDDYAAILSFLRTQDAEDRARGSAAE